MTAAAAATATTATTTTTTTTTTTEANMNGSRGHHVLASGNLLSEFEYNFGSIYCGLSAQKLCNSLPCVMKSARSAWTCRCHPKSSLYPLGHHFVSIHQLTTTIFLIYLIILRNSFVLTHRNYTYLHFECCHHYYSCHFKSLVK